MKAHELLIPRFKVILDYPNSSFVIGDIIELDAKDSNGMQCVFTSDMKCWGEETLLRHPSIFRRMDWYEERQIRQMPKYVEMDFPNPKRKKIGTVFTVERWINVGESLPLFLVGFDGSVAIFANEVIPITDEQYDEY